MKTGTDLIAEERQRQIRKGWTIDHDDGHEYGTLAVVAATLAVNGTDAIVDDALERGTAKDYWGLESKHGYPNGNPIRKLAIAGALIAAEIDRLNRKNPTALNQ